jgi:hypothetical protein
MRMEPSNESDLKQIEDWTIADPWHKIVNPGWWLTGNGLLSFRLDDVEGPLCYVRLDAEDKHRLIRLNTQFAPEEVVSKKRLVLGMLWCLPILVELSKNLNMKGLIYYSESPSLVAFLQKNFKFETKGDNHTLMFGV